MPGTRVLRRNKMNEKIIKGIIRRKIDSWIKSIDDENLREKCQENTIVTGGCIVSMLTGEKVNDFDIYFKDIETVFLVAQYYFKKIDCEKDEDDKVIKLDDRVKTFIRSKGFLKAKKIKMEESEDGDTIVDGEKKEKPVFQPVFITSNAITLTDKIQIITRFFGTPKEIHQNYDYVHCTCYYDSGEKDLVLPQKALLSILTKQLRYVGSKYPVCSIFRLRKFVKRGWHINAGEIFKICFQVSELNLTDASVLEDQLVGVDTQYFVWFLDKIKEAVDTDQAIDYDYVKDLIDELFN
jgi:hypothetical protein